MLNNIGEEQKKKFLVITVLLLILAGYFFYLNSKKSKNRLSKIETPMMNNDKAKVDYDNKLKAISKKELKKDTVIKNQESFYIEPKKEVIEKKNSPRNTRKINKKRVVRKTPTRKKYNPYGEREMWNERTINTPEYKENRAEKVVETPSKENSLEIFSEDEIKLETELNLQIEDPLEIKITAEETAEEKLRNAIRNKYSNSSSKNILNTVSNIKTAIHNDQTITANNNIVRLRLLEPIKTKNRTIDTDAYVYAEAKFSKENRIDLFVENISYKGEVFNLNLWAYDYTMGSKGIRINEDNIIGNLANDAKNIANEKVNSYGIIGGLIKTIINGTNKKTKIKLDDEHWIYLRNTK